LQIVSLYPLPESFESVRDLRAAIALVRELSHQPCKRLQTPAAEMNPPLPALHPNMAEVFSNSLKKIPQSLVIITARCDECSLVPRLLSGTSEDHRPGRQPRLASVLFLF
jgi:hypothetical protein